MVPSAPITAPAPVAPPEFDLQSNGHVAFAQKLPGKSNLKQTSTIPSTSSNGASSIAGEPHEDGQGEGERGSKVHWIDDYGKELTQVFEFEPSSDSDDSEDDDDDSDSSQSCTCVIQ